MATSVFHWVSRILKCLLLAIAAGYIFLYLFVALSRIQYPFELEWLEGSLVDHVRRILAGQRLYVIPSLEFIPFFYTPLYFYLSAGVSKILGVGFFPLRLISFIASLGCFAVLYLIVERETKSRFSAFLSASLFAATFRASGAWFDIARVDSLFLFFLLAAVYAVRFKTSLNWTVLAGALISLSFLTKQTALIISLPIMLYCVYADWRRSIFLIGIVASVVTGTTLLLDNIHDGWYAYYIFRVPAHHAIIRNMFVDFWTKDLLLALPVACLMSAWCLYAKFSYMTRKTFLFYFLMTGGMVGASWLSRLHEGGYDNVLMTAYAALSILFGLTVHTAIRWLRTMSLGVRSPGETAIYLACITQFAFLVYNPIRQIPTRQDLQAGRELIGMLALVDGEIYLGDHGYLSSLAGKTSYAHEETMYTVWAGDPGLGRTKLTEEVEQAIRGKKFSAIILDADRFRKIWFDGLDDNDFRGYCTRQKPIFDDPSVFWPVTGVRVRPEVVIYLCPKGSQ